MLLLGLAHQLAIGQAAFYMIGGYGSAILTTRYGWDGASAALASVAVAAVVVAGWWANPAEAAWLRAGDRLAGAAAAVHRASPILLVSITGGAAGIPAVPRFSLGGWLFGRDLELLLRRLGIVAARCASA